MQCIFEDCDTIAILTFEAPDLGDTKYPLCKAHVNKHFKDRESVLNLKAMLRAMSPVSAVQPKREEPPPPPPPPEEPEEEEDLDDWEASMFGG